MIRLSQLLLRCCAHARHYLGPIFEQLVRGCEPDQYRSAEPCETRQRLIDVTGQIGRLVPGLLVFCRLSRTPGAAPHRTLVPRGSTGIAVGRPNGIDVAGPCPNPALQVQQSICMGRVSQGSCQW
jgi:hypothetical protein